MKSFRFPRTIKRKPFTTIFGGVGKRRYVQDFMSYIPSPLTRVFHIFPRQNHKRFKMQWTRRSHQGWRNRVYGGIMGLKLRLQFGRRRPTTTFRR
jgi:hypothetical protein